MKQDQAQTQTTISWRFGDPVKDVVTGQVGRFYERWWPSSRECRWFNTKGETWIIKLHRLAPPMPGEARAANGKR